MGRMPASSRRCAWTPTSSSQCFRRAAALPAPASRAQVTAALTPKYARVARSGSGIPSACRWRSTNIAATVTCAMDLAGGVRLPTKPGHLRRGRALSSAGQKIAAAVEQELSRQFSGAPIRFALQSEQLGTAHAVLCAEEALRGFEGNVLILA